MKTHHKPRPHQEHDKAFSKVLKFRWLAEERQIQRQVQRPMFLSSQCCRAFGVTHHPQHGPGKVYPQAYTMPRIWAAARAPWDSSPMGPSENRLHICKYPGPPSRPACEASPCDTCTPLGGEPANPSCRSPAPQDVRNEAPRIMVPGHPSTTR